MINHVVNVFTLADLLDQTVPEPVVCLSLTERTISVPYTGGFSLPATVVNIDVQTIGKNDWLLWLHYSQELQRTPGGDGFMDHGVQDYYNALPDLRDMVRDHLRARGCTVFPGKFSLSNDHQPTRGQIEIAVWNKTAGMFVLAEGVRRFSK